jgi:PAS domain S-box-containing protein
MDWPKRLLIVGSDPEGAAAIGARLRKSSWHPTPDVQAASGPAALERALRNPPFDAAVVLRGLEWAKPEAVRDALRSHLRATGFYEADSPEQFAEMATRAVEELHARNRRRAGFNAVPIGLWRGDLGGTIFDANDGFCRMLGRLPTTGSPTHWREIVADERELHYFLETMGTRGTVQDQPLTIRREDNRLLPTRLSAAVAHDGGWLIEGAITEIVRRAPDRIAEHAFAGMIEVSLPERRILWANEHFTALAGLRGEDAIGVDVRTCWHPSEHRRLNAELRQRLHHGPDAWEDERRLLHRNGGTSWVHVNGRLLRNGDGRATRAVLVIHDITARRRFETAQRAARQAAEGAAAAKDEFLAKLSHELRTPLAPALTASTMLADDESLSTQVRDDAELIRHNLECQARLLDDLLDLNRATTGQLRLRRSKFRLHAVLHDAAQVIRPDAEAKGVDLSSTCTDADELFVHADRTRIEQVAWNLLKNAVKFTPAGGRVTIECAAAGAGRVAFQVIDTGIGIERADLDRIFDAFAQGNRNGEETIHGKGAGLGLGLAVSRGIVQLHDGRLSVESDGVGRGSTFRVELASCEPPVGGEAETVEPPVVGARVLLVDDHTSTARLLGRLLRSHGYETSSATTLAEARRMVSGAPDAIVCDLMLPDGHGHDLANELSLTKNRPALLAVSGHGSPDDVRAALAAGFDAHLTKPAAPDVLMATLARLLRRRATK